MDAKEQLIHDIVVLEERLTRHYKAAQQPIDEIRKLQKRQHDAIDTYHQAKSKEEADKISSILYDLIVNCSHTIQDENRNVWRVIETSEVRDVLAAFGKEER